MGWIPSSRVLQVLEDFDMESSGEGEGKSDRFFFWEGGGDFDTLDFWLAKNGEHGENHLLLATSGAPMTKKP